MLWCLLVPTQRRVIMRGEGQYDVTTQAWTRRWPFCGRGTDCDKLQTATRMFWLQNNCASALRA
jgi:hypothetical protein